MQVARPSRHERQDAGMQEDEVFVRFYEADNKYAAIDEEHVGSWDRWTRSDMSQYCDSHGGLKAAFDTATRALQSRRVSV